MINTLSIRKLVSYLNNPIEQGGFWLPNVQKSFVWDEKKIVKFLDSIMREYPIGHFLVLRTESPVKYRRFVSTYSEKLNLISASEPINEYKKFIILDGQQRMQSLYMIICGSYEGREMYFNLLSGKDINEDNIKYQFKFLKEEEVEWNYIKLKDIVNARERRSLTRRKVIAKIKKVNPELSDDLKIVIDDNVDQIINRFVSKEILAYDVLDNVDKSGYYDPTDILEIITRANARGTILEREELISSLQENDYSKKTEENKIIEKN
ncbi:MAG: DUF262 domain-containing protein [Sarcina sp.]